MYHEGSLKAGLATRAIRCDNACNWDIRDDSLVWSNTKGEVSVQHLRSLSSKSIHLDVRRCFPEPFAIEYLRLLSDTELLIVTSLSLPSKDPKLCGTEKLIKTSTRETGSWIVNLEASVSRPAIGTDFIYLVQGPPALYDENNQIVDNDHIKLRFMKLKQSDGSVVLDVPIPLAKARLPGSGGKIRNDRSLVLSKDESCAVWTDWMGLRYIFSTSSGQMLLHRYHASGVNVASSLYPGFWHTAV